MSAGEAKPEVNPAVPHLQAFFTASAVCLAILRGLQMITGVGHTFSHLDDDTLPASFQSERVDAGDVRSDDERVNVVRSFVGLH